MWRNKYLFFFSVEKRNGCSGKKSVKLFAHVQKCAHHRHFHTVHFYIFILFSSLFLSTFFFPIFTAFFSIHFSFGRFSVHSFSEKWETFWLQRRIINWAVCLHSFVCSFCSNEEDRRREQRGNESRSFFSPFTNLLLFLSFGIRYWG